MQYLQSGYAGKEKELRVVLLNDIHFGSEALDYGLLERIRKYLDNHPTARILINGDIIEGVIKSSKGDIYLQRKSPKEQINEAVEFFRPYKDRIDGVTKGNHDFRIELETSIDVVEMLCRYLGIDDKYLGYEGIVGFSWNKCFYAVQLHHGTGGGSTVAAVENAMKKIWKSDAHVMYCGHWHKEFAKPVKRYAIDPYNGKVREEKRWMVCGNTCVNTAVYAKRYAFEESFPSQAVLILSGNNRKKDIQVEWIR